MSSVNDVGIEVVLALPRQCYRLSFSVPVGTCAREAVKQALARGLLPPGAEVDIDVALAPLGIYAERVDDDYQVSDGDRLEIYRPLQQNPMELRRKRARVEPGKNDC